MDAMSSFQSQSIDIELDYDGRLRFHMENAHGAKIFRDCLQRYTVKVEDHPSDIDLAPWVNFQGDRYMGGDGCMYLLTETPEDVDQLGNFIPEKGELIEEGPPMPERPGLRLINSIWVRRVLIDDKTKVLYKREETLSEFYYLRHSSLDCTITEDKILYVFVEMNLGEYRDVVFLDKYNLKWDLMLSSDIGGLTYQGMPLANNRRGLGCPSNCVYHAPRCLQMSTPSALSIHTLRSTTSAHRASFLNLRPPPPVGTYEPKPMGIISTLDTSGNLVNKGQQNHYIHTYLTSC